MRLVPRTRTPVALEDLAPALVAGFHDACGYEPAPEAVALAWSQLCLEAGVAGDVLRGLFNDNLGNHDADAEERASGPVFETVFERELGAGGVEYHATHIRPAYDDLEGGAEGYWRRLRSGFPEAFAAMDGGDPQAFAVALKSERYFTDDAHAYAAGLARWLAEYSRRFAR